MIDIATIEVWVVEGVLTIGLGILLAGMLCWLFNEIDKK